MKKLRNLNLDAKQRAVLEERLRSSGLSVEKAPAIPRSTAGDELYRRLRLVGAPRALRADAAALATTLPAALLAVGETEKVPASVIAGTVLAIANGAPDILLELEDGLVTRARVETGRTFRETVRAFGRSWRADREHALASPGPAVGLDEATLVRFTATANALAPAPERLLSELGVVLDDTPPASSRTEIDDVYPLSPMQEGLFFLALAGETDPYVVSVDAKLGAEFDEVAFARAWATVRDRHAILRTRFEWERLDRPMQIVGRETEPIEIVDLRGKREDEVDAAIVALVSEARRRSIRDLQCLRLLRSDAGWRVLWTVHHAVTEAWTMKVVLDELLAHYAADRGGRPLSLEPVAPYRGFIDWTEQRDASASERWFGAYLRGFTTPTAVGPSPSEHLPSVREERVIDEPTTARIAASARSMQITQNTLVQAAWGIVLAKTSGETDVVFGATTAGRSAPVAGIERMTGLFINTLPVRVRVARGVRVGDWLRRIQGEQNEAREHEQLPLGRIQAVSEVERGRELFDSVVGFENFPVPEVDAADQNALPIDVVSSSWSTHYAASLTAVPGPTLTLALFGPLGAWAGPAAGRLVRTIEWLADHPDEELGALPFGAPEERARLATWNETTTRWDDERLVHAVVAETARANGTRVALALDGATATYAELDAWSNRIAHRLRGIGVGRDDLVPLLLERSFAMVAAIQGVMRAGAAYVPIDPEAPPKRTRAMLDELRPRVVLVHRRINGEDAIVGHHESLALDDLLLAHDVPGPLLAPVVGTGAAYAIYTSGSTGAPKGTINTHAGLANRLAWMQSAFPIGPSDRVLQKTPYTFDVSVWELVWPLMHGAKIVIARPGGHRDPRYLADTIRAEAITLCHFVPSMLEAFLEEPSLATCTSLTRVIVSGEALSPAVVRRFTERLPWAKLENLYGPTEAAIDVTWWSATTTTDSVPIGRPIANTRIHIVDDDLEEAAIGAPGELCIAGVQLARGYLERPDLTADRFVPDPNGALGARMYRTGDRARWREDGEIEYLGRIDHQVKLRGFRIELGEIESVLATQPGVRSAVVTVREDTPGDKRLVAYVVPARDDPGDGASSVEDWSAIFDAAYAGDARDPTFDIASWNSSYDGKPLPAEEMRDWVDGTVSWIGDVTGKRVLEIGAGTGLLLFRLAPAAAEYVALDTSARAVALLKRNVALLGAKATSVHVEQRPADAIDVLAPGAFDVVIVNSVAQYFPSRAYLDDVLTKAARLLKAGGRIHVGDVRSLPLARAFRASVRAAQGGGADVHAERELLIDPGFFSDFRARSPNLRTAVATAKRGSYVNELSRFRYDVELSAEAPRDVAVETRTWGDETPAEVDALLVERAPNPRLEAVPFAGSLPSGFVVAAVLAPTTDDGTTSLVAVRRERTADASVVAAVAALAHRRRVTPAEVTNRPAAASSEQILVEALTRAARTGLPDYMVPNAFVVLDELPLGSSGKVDRRSLPAPRSTARAEAFVAPRSPTEQAIASIFADVLGVARVSIHDDFFALGGHSLLATRVVSRMRADLGRDVQLRAFFDARTVARLAASVSAAVDPTEIERADRSKPLLLSYAQARLWILEQLETGSNASYNLPFALRVKGPLDEGALSGAFDALVARHESLRTTFAVGVGGEVAQRIHPPPTGVLAIDDASALDDAAIGARVEAFSHEPFDLEAGPLFRALLLRRTDERVLCITIHHIVSDGWSHGVIVADLAALYAGELPPLGLQYADYAAWQRRHLEGPLLAGGLAFFVEQLSGAPFALELPTDRARPRQQTFAGSTLRFEVGSSLAAKLRATGREHGSTLFMTLLAAYAVLVGRTACQDDIVVGTPIANRTRAELEQLVGFFVNTLPIRIRLAADEPFTSMLARVREACLGAFDHQLVPFEKIVEAVNPPRDLGRNPILQTMFVLQNAPLGEVIVDDIAFDLVVPENRTAKFDLTLEMVETPEGLLGSFEYNTDLFDRTTIERLRDAFGVLLEAIARDPSTPTARLALLPDAERRRVIFESNDTAKDLGRHVSVYELFEAQAARTPAAIAAISATERVSYDALARRSRALASVLKARGVGLEDRVALALGRSVESLVAMIAVLRCGGAYVPIDPRWPLARIERVLASSHATTVITSGASPAWARELVVVDAAATATTSAPEHEDVPGHPQQAAYVLYTSGSTGEPKGVVVTHAGLRNYVEFARTAYDVDAATRSVLHSPLAFDLTVTSIWPALVAGGTVEVIAEEDAIEGLLARLRSGDPGLLVKLTPAHLEILAHQKDAAQLDRLVRTWVVGGEALHGDALSPLTSGARSTLVNEYGPTETVVGCTTFSQPTRSVAGVVPIGVPLTNTRAYVLDPRGEPVGIGVVGELFVGGGQVARGYLGRPDATAEKFLPDPFSTDGGERMYRTGDLARWRVDGALEYLGRADQQVKIRGLRIELEEIESVLAPLAREAVVVAREDAPGDRRLVAYVVDSKEREDGLRAALARELPDYMVPSAFVVLERLPLTPNGKIDRSALPAPAASNDTFAEPVTANERLVAAAFQDVLGLPAVGLDSDFFSLGGHSLLATRLLTKLRDRTGSELSLRAVFEHARVRDLARHLDAASRVAASVIPRVDRSATIPLSFAQERLWVIDQLEPGSIAYNVPITLRIRGPLDVDRLAAAFDALVARHESLRTSIVVRDGLPAQHIQEPPTGILRVVDASSSTDSDVAAATQAEADRPFDLAADRPLRATLLRRSESEHVLSLSMHHIASDGWSEGVLVADLGALYAKEPLVPLSVQVADFSVWQRTQLGAGRLAEGLRFWTNHLDGAPAAIELPYDRARPAVQTYAGDAVRFEVPAALFERVNALGRAHGTTPFMTMLAAFAMMLSRHSSQDDIVVGVPVANRDHRELEPLIGFLSNTVALRVRTDVDTFAALLESVRTNTLAAFEHGEIPFEKVVEAVDPPRDRSRSPIFQTMFAMQNALPTETDVGDVTFETVVTEHRTAKFDVMLYAFDYGSAVSAALEYNTDLFDRVTVEAMVETFLTILERASANPQASLRTLAPGPEAPAASIVARSSRSIGGVHRIFEQAAARYPRASALVMGDREISYESLDRMASAVARQIAPGVIVGVCAERGVAMIVSVLAVLKAGAAYAPIDPAYPAERIAHMIEDAEITLALTTKTTDARIQALGVRTLVVGDDSDAPSFSRAVSPDALAYVIFTSGSTGRPKGVAMRHLALENLVAWQADVLHRERPRTLQFSSLSFDVSFQELFTTWHAGGSIVLVDDETRRDPRALLLLIQKLLVDRLFLPFVALQQLAEEHASMDVTTALREVVTAGEQLRTTPALTRFFREHPNARLFNHYGPSETHVVTALSLDADPEKWEPLPSIGRAIDGVTTHVLDPRLDPVPPGVRGELYLGGVALAQGYVGRPDLTAERFVPSPFALGERLYRTGDVAARRRDGTLVFLGRVDNQVKVRGYRIELGEIEAAIARDPRVKDVAVVVREDRPGDRRLVAYVAGAVDVAALRARLAASLAAYMIPSAFVILESLPLTASGKTNRRALPAPAMEDRALVGPETPEEERLAMIWRDVLGVDAVSATDDFFDLGGQSLLATRTASAIRAAFGVDIPLRLIFDQTRLRDLARAIAGIAQDTHRAAPIPRVDRSRPIPLSFAQRRLWFVEQLNPGRGDYHVVIAVRIRGPLSVSSLSAAFDMLVARHEPLRTTFVSEGEEPAQQVHPPTPISLRAEPADAADVDRLSAEESRRPFDFRTGPLFRVRLFALGTDDHALVFTMHHIVTDGWSLEVIFDELTHVYEAIESGTTPELAPLPIQYADYAAWQRTWLSGDELERQTAYWKSRLAGLEPFDPPTDRPRPALQDPTRAIIPVPADEAVWKNLEELGRREGATFFMSLVAAWAVLSWRFSGQRDIAIGSPVAGRTRTELDRLVGIFINILALRVDVDPRSSFRSLLAAVRKTALDAYAHQDLPFERVVEALQPERDLSRAPIVQTVVSLQHASRETAQAGFVSFEPIDTGLVDARYDLSLLVQETANGPWAGLSYGAALFEPARMERLAASFVELLREIAISPDAPLEDLARDPRPNADVFSLPSEEGGVFALFEERAARDPSRIAVRCGDVTLDFVSLRDRSLVLAAKLRADGVAVGEQVILQCERSVEMIVAMLGVLAAGAAFVPVDPSAPSARLETIARESGAKIVVRDADVRVLGEPSAGRRVANASLAYILFTSGSTGTPKGVAVTHGSLVNLFRALSVTAYAEIPAPAVVAMNGSYTFDTSMKQLVMLLGGYTLDIVPEDTRYAAEKFWSHLETHEVAVLDITPAQLRALVADREQAPPNALRAMLVGGEAIDAVLWSALAALPVSVFNVYGPTECTVDATVHRVDGTTPALGRALPNVVLHVLDERMRPVTRGMPGELFIGGAGLARGYVGRPDLTAERFRPNPYGDGDRLYATGDIVRERDEGTLVYLKRSDGQVKVRGFRIELGEVEATVRQTEGVRDAVVVLKAERLVAYVVGSATAADVKAAVALRLPAYMVPAVFVVLDRIPLTPNGKVDRRGLPEPMEDAPAATPMATSTEATVRTIWASALGLAEEQVGRENDFFDLGGHSLLATQVISRIHKELGVELEIRAFFAGPTVEKVAAAIDAAKTTTKSSNADKRAIARAARAGRRMIRSESGDIEKKDDDDD